jgi:NAD(P)-dependent dehydrogenase (short-subunit alcohol dehydrogenase family)
MTSQVMVLSGCASGIGRHLARALSRRGHRVLATDIDEVALARAGASDGWRPELIATRRLDVRSEEDWEGALDDVEQRFGPVDVLFNIAGFLRPAYATDAALRDLELCLDVNVKGTILGTRAAARRMTRARRGHIVNFGSLASLAPVPGLSIYTASKFAVRGFSLAAAAELREHGVAVTVVLPDAVATPMLELQVAHDEAALTFSGQRPLTVEDVERALLTRVLVDRPLELAIPAGRGALARLAGTAPGVSRLLAPMLVRKGRRAQDQRRAVRAEKKI